MSALWSQFQSLITGNEALLYSLVVASVVMFFISLFVVPWLIIQIPPDYFSHDRKERMSLVVHSPLLQTLLKCTRNVVGGLFILVGIILCFIPGQGLLTMLVGLFLMNFPGKEKLLRKVVSYPVVLKSMNALRRRAGHDALQI